MGDMKQWVFVGGLALLLGACAYTNEEKALMAELGVAPEDFECRGVEELGTYIKDKECMSKQAWAKRDELQREDAQGLHNTLGRMSGRSETVNAGMSN